MKTNPTESPKALVLPAVGHLGRGSERVQAQAAPARRTLEEWGSQWPALCPGPPEATLLRGLPPGLPPGPRLLNAPVQGWSTAPSAKHPEPAPSLEASTFWEEGLVHSRALHLPPAPKVPRRPTSRTEPASPLPAHRSQDPTPLRQEPPMPALPLDQPSAQPHSFTLENSGLSFRECEPQTHHNVL